MNLARGYRANSKIKVRQINGCVSVAIGMNSESVLVIKLPNSRVLRIISRSLFLAMFIIALPSISSIVRDASVTSNSIEDYSSALTRPSDLIRFESLPMVFKHLVDEGLLKNGHKGLLLSSGPGDLFDNLWFLNDKGIELVIDSDLERPTVIPNESFDFVFASSIENTMFINRVVKLDGIVVFPFGNHHDYSYEFSKLSNYKIVYLHQFDSIAVIAMQKVDGIFNSQRKRRLCGVTEESNREALNGLEDVMLEPPLEEWRNSVKIKFFADLLGDSYESYKRRIFITDAKDGGVNWFYKNYPTRNHVFEVYEIEEMVADSEIRVSEWLRKKVKKEDYVVMKAEAGVVEEMVKEKTVCLVDELFLKCDDQWRDQRKKKKGYWECVALYGKLRDEGIAVHQWWGQGRSQEISDVGA